MKGKATPATHQEGENTAHRSAVAVAAINRGSDLAGEIRKVAGRRCPEMNLLFDPDYGCVLPVVLGLEEN